MAEISGELIAKNIEVIHYSVVYRSDTTFGTATFLARYWGQTLYVSSVTSVRLRPQWALRHHVAAAWPTSYALEIESISFGSRIWIMPKIQWVLFNVIICHAAKFHENRSLSFWVIPLTNKKPIRRTEGKNTPEFSRDQQARYVHYMYQNRHETARH